MVKYIVARQLSGKKVVTSDGEAFGKLIDVDIDELSGKIEYLVVEATPSSASFEEKLQHDDDGHILLPYESVMAIGDYVIVDKRHLLQ